MNIENHVLTLGDFTYDLPRLPVDATVRCWSVPAGYAPAGYFVSVQVPGGTVELPACSALDAVLVGQEALPADPDAELADLKRQKKEEVSAVRYSRQVAGVRVGDYIFHTDGEGRASINEAMTHAKLHEDQNGPGTYSVEWKTQGRHDDPQDKWVTLSLAELLTAGLAVGTYVSDCFSRDKAICAAIDAALDEAGVVAAYEDNIDIGWPAQE